jgi:hypothetical protein
METAFEKILTNSHRSTMEKYVAVHPESFEEAIKLAIADKQPYSWRAAWLLWSCMEKNDKRIRKHLKDIINVLPKRKDNQKRELLKILEQMEIHNKLEGILFNHCVNIWEKIDKQPAVRFNAFKILAKIAKRHPELAKEIILLTHNQYTESLSSAVNKSINKIIKENYLLK